LYYCIVGVFGGELFMDWQLYLLYSLKIPPQKVKMALYLTRPSTKVILLEKYFPHTVHCNVILTNLKENALARV